jgi:formylglycine-generating enzyme required for sulfatase activity
MKTRKSLTSIGLAVLAGVSHVTPASASMVDIAWVTVGDAGNKADTRVGTGSLGYGAVGYAYQIGKYEVTNAQYVGFLNAADPSGANANGIYNTKMGSEKLGGISYTSAAASGAKYTIRTNMDNKPVNFVDWYDAARFSNWLGNGQGTGSTETGAYTLSGNTGDPTKNEGATVWIPSENEWYKAAYYDPANSSYSLYPTQSNTTPVAATADAVGNISNSGTNVANYNYGVRWNGEWGNLSTVGSAGAASASFYGTFDQGGNVYEWDDVVISAGARGQRGGSYNTNFANLSSTSTHGSGLGWSFEYDFTGFRVASYSEMSAVPEVTSSFTLLGLITSGLLLRRRTKRSR